MSRSWVRVTAIVLGICLALVLGWAVTPRGQRGASQSAPDAAGPRIGAVAPSFRAVATDGTTIDLSELRGRPVWLSFGGTWCAGCRSESPDMKAVQDRAKAEGVVMVQIYLDEGVGAVSEFATMMGLTFAQVPDPQAEISAKYRARAVPVHYFIAKDGTIQGVHQGILTRAQMDDKISAMAKA